MIQAAVSNLLVVLLFMAFGMWLLSIVFRLISGWGVLQTVQYKQGAHVYVATFSQLQTTPLRQIIEEHQATVRSGANMLMSSLQLPFFVKEAAFRIPTTATRDSTADSGALSTAGVSPSGPTISRPSLCLSMFSMLPMSLTLPHTRGGCGNNTTLLSSPLSIMSHVPSPNRRDATATNGNTAGRSRPPHHHRGLTPTISLPPSAAIYRPSQLLSPTLLSTSGSIADGGGGAPPHVAAAGTTTRVGFEICSPSNTGREGDEHEEGEDREMDAIVCDPNANLNHHLYHPASTTPPPPPPTTIFSSLRYTLIRMHASCFQATLCSMAMLHRKDRCLNLGEWISHHHHRGGEPPQDNKTASQMPPGGGTPAPDMAPMSVACSCCTWCRYITTTDEEEQQSTHSLQSSLQFIDNGSGISEVTIPLLNSEIRELLVAATTSSSPTSPDGDGSRRRVARVTSSGSVVDEEGTCTSVRGSPIRGGALLGSLQQQGFLVVENEVTAAPEALRGARNVNSSKLHLSSSCHSKYPPCSLVYSLQWKFQSMPTQQVATTNTGIAEEAAAASSDVDSAALPPPPPPREGDNPLHDGDPAPSRLLPPCTFECSLSYVRVGHRVYKVQPVFTIENEENNSATNVSTNREAPPSPPPPPPSHGGGENENGESGGGGGGGNDTVDGADNSLAVVPPPAALPQLRPPRPRPPPLLSAASAVTVAEEETAAAVVTATRQSEREEEREEEELPMCIVCYSNPRNVLVLPCAHFAFCMVCLRRLNQCPVCRTEIAFTVCILQDVAPV